MRSNGRCRVVESTTANRPKHAALRELAEEVGPPPRANAVLGRLDDFVTRSGFVITPVVVWAGAAEVLTPNPQEVASIHRIPVQEFMREMRRCWTAATTARSP